MHSADAQVEQLQHQTTMLLQRKQKEEQKMSAVSKLIDEASRFSEEEEALRANSKQFAAAA